MGLWGVGGEEPGTGPGWALPGEVLWIEDQYKRGQETWRQQPHRPAREGKWRKGSPGAGGTEPQKPREPRSHGSREVVSMRVLGGLKPAQRGSSCRGSVEGADALGNEPLPAVGLKVRPEG